MNEQADLLEELPGTAYTGEKDQERIAMLTDKTLKGIGNIL